ncbi:hypothetical protein WICPIJ_005597 [Wickerhamomyces pijperi]|uniref:Urea transport protein n=1 Tax=Wickerhamomyces pijperi TaxID=599730 RepID=A0A9P8Q5P4_WICPI|nr:hypothetical protein WICPIJ_005597 [Wickerhamomyces pijperi]
MISESGNNAIIYCTYSFFLVTGLTIAWIYRDKKTFLSANGTQSGVPLSLNFVASSFGCGIMASYPQVANLTGLQGLLVYALTGGLPMLLFSWLGPIIRRQCPHGFVLTEWVFQRFGTVTGLYLSACTILTLYLFIVSEITSIQYAVETLTGRSALPAIIVQCVVTSIYTSLGGFKVSFITDNIQIAFGFAMIVIVAAAMGHYVEIDTSKIAESGLLKPNLVGWQLIYILIMAIFTNDMFMSGFWLRTFAAKSDKDLWIGCSIAAFINTCIAVIFGSTGLIAVWMGLVAVGDEGSSASFYMILTTMPNWVSGIVLFLVLCLATGVMDSLQSALTSTISNDIFRNKIDVMWCRLIVVLIMFPVVAVGVKVANDVLQIYFIADLLSSAVVPVIMLGLSSKFYFLTGFEAITGGLGGLLAVFIFGTIYYGNAKDGGRLLLIWNGIYGGDWGCFAAFVVAPGGALLSAAIALGVRLSALKLYAWKTGTVFTALDRPEPIEIDREIGKGKGEDEESTTIEVEKNDEIIIDQEIDKESPRTLSNVLSSLKNALNQH